MKIIRASYEILTPIDGADILRRIEQAGRVCYKSEDAITEGSAQKFVAGIIRRGHESVLEHVSLTVQFTVDRGVTHELVRHRLCSFSQESTRYCNYSGEKFGHDVRFVIPYSFEKRNGEDKPEQLALWAEACLNAEKAYFDLLDAGATPQEARTVLPNSTAADIVVSADLREWRHILRLRTAKDAHPQIREVMCPLLEELKSRIPVVFDDLEADK